MRIKITGQETIVVHGSRRLAARLHRWDRISDVEATVSHLVDTELIAEADRDKIAALACTMSPQSVAGWQCVLAAYHDPQHQDVLVRARIRELAKVSEPALEQQQEEQQHVYVFRKGWA